MCCICTHTHGQFVYDMLRYITQAYTHTQELKFNQPSSLHILSHRADVILNIFIVRLSVAYMNAHH